MEWPVIVGLAAIFILGSITIGLAKSRWNHRKVIRAAIKEAKLEAAAEAARETVLESSRDERQAARSYTG